jgi:hypothetical protein
VGGHHQVAEQEHHQAVDGEAAGQVDGGRVRTGVLTRQTLVVPSCPGCNLHTDESALTGESVPTGNATMVVEPDAPPAERIGRAYAGCFVTALSITAQQVLWLNMIMSRTMSIALARAMTIQGLVLACWPSWCIWETSASCAMVCWLCQARAGVPSFRPQRSCGRWLALSRVG